MPGHPAAGPGCDPESRTTPPDAQARADRARRCSDDPHKTQWDRLHAWDPFPRQPHTFRRSRLPRRNRSVAAGLRRPGHPPHRAPMAGTRNQVRRQRPTERTTRTTQNRLSVTDVLRQKRHRCPETSHHHRSSQVRNHRSGINCCLPTLCPHLWANEANRRWSLSLKIIEFAGSFTTSRMVAGKCLGFKSHRLCNRPFTRFKRNHSKSAPKLSQRLPRDAKARVQIPLAQCCIADQE